MRSSWLAITATALLGLSLWLPACGDDNESSSASSSSSSAMGGHGGGGGEPVCGSANADLDTSQLIQLAHDDGQPLTHLREQEFAYQSWVFNEHVLYEAVRFELEHPARIHGFEVMWAALPEGLDPKAELTAGVYDDFGYNGFDFWAPEPLWTGTRCIEDIDDTGQTWTRYTLDTPVEVTHPGLIYVAHRTAPGEPVWWFDGVQEGPDEAPCDNFDHCQSAYNLPEANVPSSYNGLSLSFPLHFMVRLWVEYTDDVQPEDKLFQAVTDAPTGSHVSFVDYDRDGYDDLLAGGLLWHNNGDGTFTDVTEAAGLGGINPTGGVWGDYDNDGCLDLFAFKESTSAPDHLLHSNCDGTFTDVTAASAITEQQTYEDCGGNPANTEAPTAAAAWFDLEADGLLDLYLANYECGQNGQHYIDTVWHNNGDGTFSPLTGMQGFSGQRHASRNVTPIDHDGDGDVDVMVGAYRLQRNQLFENQGDGTVVEVAQDVGLAGTLQQGWYGHTIGTTWGDLDNDGDFDSIAANLAHPRYFHFSDKTQVLINDGSGHYTDLGGDWLTPVSGAGLRFQETHMVPQLLDANNNGILDLAISCVYNGRPSDFYWGHGDGTFTLDAYHAGITTENGRSMAIADFDHDGDVDLFSRGLFRNTVEGSAKGHWVQVHVTGTAANRAAIGATIRVTSGAITRIRHVQGGNGKGTQDSLYLHFGLGDASQIDQIQVMFPGGDEVTFPGPFAADQRLFVKQDEPNKVMSGWAPTF